jgi:hypothetical protein
LPYSSVKACQTTKVDCSNPQSGCDPTIQGPWGRNPCRVFAVLDLNKDGSPRKNVENAKLMPGESEKLVQIASYNTAVFIFLEVVQFPLYQGINSKKGKKWVEK